jgi:hypothetical protein
MMLTTLRQWLCSHRIALDNLRRTSPDRVECQCHRCGKMLTAEYGIALKGTWERLPVEAQAPNGTGQMKRI